VFIFAVSVSDFEKDSRIDMVMTQQGKFLVIHVKILIMPDSINAHQLASRERFSSQFKG
jgi:hypothetical protein